MVEPTNSCTAVYTASAAVSGVAGKLTATMLLVALRAAAAIPSAAG